MYPIDKGIPIPKINHDKPSTTYPFKEMNVGDSFLIPDGEKKSTARSAALIIAKRMGIKVLTRKIEGGLRVWRIE